MNDRGNLPSQREVSRFANTGLITIFAMLVAAGVPVALSKLIPGLPFAALMVIFGVLMIPVLVGYGLVIRHMIRSVRLSRVEQQGERVVYTNRLGGILAQHPYAVASVVIVGSLLIALIWTLVTSK